MQVSARVFILVVNDQTSKIGPPLRSIFYKNRNLCYTIFMTIPLQQTKAWQKLQQDLGKTTFFIEENDYTILAIEKQTKIGGKYLYLPYGPALHPKITGQTSTSAQTALKNAAKSAYKALEALAHQKNITFIRIEPQTSEIADFWSNLPNSKKSKDLSPKETWVLDLTPEKSAIISGFSQGTRTRYNQFAKKGLSVTTSKNPADIKYLVALQQKLAKKKNFGAFSEKYLKTELEQPFSTLYLVHYDPENAATPPNPEKSSLLAEKGDKIIAASLFFDHEDTRYYMQSAANLDYKKLPGTVALLTTAIFDAKEKGLKKFDFWGIAPENAEKDHPWAGFTAFKKSFGGYEVDYCGTFDLVFQPVKYKLYRLARRGNRFLRKALRK